jgi:hypothetical protein
VLGAAAALEGEERWTLDKVMAMHKEGGVTVSKMLEEPQRRLMLRKEIDKKLNDGKGALQTCYILCYKFVILVVVRSGVVCLMDAVHRVQALDAFCRLSSIRTLNLMLS